MRKLVLVLAILAFSVSAVYADALLIEDILPWGYNSNSETLGDIGISFTKIASSQIAATTLSDYQFVVYASDQPQSYYDNVATNFGLINSYVQNGGILVAHSCLWGWEDANPGWESPNYLPGGVNRVAEYTQAVNVTDPLSPIVDGPYGELTEAQFQAWNYTSHGYFTDLLAGTETILDQGTDKPIYIIYPFGDGEVRATMMTVEWGSGDNSNTRYIFRQNEFFAAQQEADQRVVPEPATMSLLGLGLLGLLGRKRFIK